MAGLDNTAAAADLLAAGRKAADSKLWRQAITVLRPLAETGHVIAVRLLSEVLCAAGRPAEAAELLGSAAEAAGVWWMLQSKG